MAGRTVSIKLDKERQLKFDLNALSEIGERLSITVRLDHLGEDLVSRPLPLSSLRTVIWAGLRHEDTDLTEQDVGAMIDQENMGYVLSRFFSLFNSNFSRPFREAVAGLMPEPDSTGVSSDDSPSAP